MKFNLVTIKRYQCTSNHGEKTWIFILTEWWPWLICILQEIFPHLFHNITIEQPDPAFNDLKLTLRTGRIISIVILFLGCLQHQINTSLWQLNFNGVAQIFYTKFDTFLLAFFTNTLFKNAYSKLSQKISWISKTLLESPNKSIFMTKVMSTDGFWIQNENCTIFVLVEIK